MSREHLNGVAMDVRAGEGRVMDCSPEEIPAVLAKEQAARDAGLRSPHDMAPSEQREERRKEEEKAKGFHGGRHGCGADTGGLRCGVRYGSAHREIVLCADCKAKVRAADEAAARYGADCAKEAAERAAGLRRDFAAAVSAPTGQQLPWAPGWAPHNDPALADHLAGCGRRLGGLAFCGGRLDGKIVTLCVDCAYPLRSVEVPAPMGQQPICGRVGCSLGADGVCVTCGACDQLAGCKRRRANYIAYAKDRLEDEDWHGGSDACNDLRELDVEIRMLEERRR